MARRAHTLRYARHSRQQPLVQLPGPGGHCASELSSHRGKGMGEAVIAAEHIAASPLQEVTVSDTMNHEARRTSCKSNPSAKNWHKVGRLVGVVGRAHENALQNEDICLYRERSVAPLKGLMERI